MPINDYKIIRQIGMGGMSQVSLGEHHQTRKQVAIKELLPNLIFNPDYCNRFRREAHILKRLNHPNIVKIYEYNETSTSFYIIMEYVDGVDLGQYIQNVTGPVSESKAIEIMSVLLNAFCYAHNNGVIHRDIKPENIIITYDGKIKVLDFGIAKLSDGYINVTHAGTRLGTVAYMSPEQINSVADLDLRSDIYSLGVLLLQLITGVEPYNKISSEFEIQNKILNEPLHRANSIYPYASAHLQKIIDKATQKKRESRFQNCVEFSKALYNYKPQVNGKLIYTSLLVIGFIAFFVIAIVNSTRQHNKVIYNIYEKNELREKKIDPLIIKYPIIEPKSDELKDNESSVTNTKENQTESLFDDSSNDNNSFYHNISDDSPYDPIE